MSFLLVIISIFRFIETFSAMWVLSDFAFNSRNEKNHVPFELLLPCSDFLRLVLFIGGGGATSLDQILSL